MMKREIFIILGMVCCFLNCKVSQTKIPEMTDCELVSKIINKVGIIDEPECKGFGIIIADTIPTFKFAQTIFLNKKLTTYKFLDFSKCDNFRIDKLNELECKPFKNMPVNSNSDPNESMYVFEEGQCYEIYVSEINNFEDKYAMHINVNNGQYEYWIDFIFKIDSSGDIEDISIMSYEPNKSRPNFNDLTNKYPTLKSKKWEYYGLPDK
jgi:hypothetical protein